MLPNFIVIGAPRCGTTWLHENLKRHPDVFLPKTKELHYFDNAWEQDIRFYESSFRYRGSERAVGEITPTYLSGAFSANPCIPESIYRLLPDVRLIAILRNPVERAYSHYCYNISQDARNVGLTFEEKIAQRPQIIQEGFYADHLERYLTLFDERQMLILLYDDLKANPRDFLRRVYRFLDVDPSFVSRLESLGRNAAQGHGNLARSKLLFQAGRVLAKAGFVATAERLRSTNSRNVASPMTLETRKRLADIYRPSNSRLAELLGRDLGHWNVA